MPRRHLTELARALTEGRDLDMDALTRGTLDAGASPQEVLDGALYPGMELVGKRFVARDIFLPEVMLAARAMKVAMRVLEPLLVGTAAATRGTVVLGTVAGDVHDVGKNLVGVMLRAAAFDVIDLGHSVPPAAFVDAARRHGASVVAMSALLTTTMVVMRSVCEALEAASLGDVRTIVGGGPVTEEFARHIGADAYGRDPGAAVEIASAWLTS